jgi:hypothetical protein
MRRGGSVPRRWVALVLREQDAAEKATYRERHESEINFALSAAYGTEVDFGSRMELLRKIAEHLTVGNLAATRIAALHLRVPELPDDAAASRLDEAERLLTGYLRPRSRSGHKRDVSNEPRVPRGQPGGGQWTMDESAVAPDAMAIPAQITIPLPGSGTIIVPRPIPILPPIPLTPVNPTLPNGDSLTPTNPFPKDERCVEEWEYATKKCSELVKRGKLGPGGAYGANYSKCLLGMVSEACGGNPVA